MRQLSGRGKSRLLLLVVVCVTVLLVSGVDANIGTNVSRVHAAPLSTCTAYWMTNNLNGYWDAEYQVDAVTSCNGTAPRGEGWLYPCSGVNVTANMDTWLSQSTARGGARLAESGRSGLVTWAGDCLWHRQVVVFGWGQVFTTPLWACLWVNDQTVNLTFNYLCVQDY